MIKKILGFLILFVMASFLVMLLAPETFRDVLIPVGLYNDKRGVFTDCTLEANRSNKFCHPDAGGGSSLKDAKERPGFSLSN